MALFVNWGKDTRAFDQTLDRKLRNSTDLRNETLSKLSTLHDQLQRCESDIVNVLYGKN